MSWKKVKFSDFLIERKDRFNPDESNDLGLNRISKIDFSGCIHISANKPTKTNMILVKNGDLVISGINADKGAVAIYKGKEDLMATIHYSSYTFDTTKINIDYLTWFLKSKKFLEVLKTQTKGGIKTELKAKKLLPLEIDMPELPLQSQILNKIESMNNENDLLVKELSLKAKLTEKLKQSILQEAIEGKLTADWRKQNSNTEPASELLKRIKEEKLKLIADKKIKKENPLPPITNEKIPFELPEGWVWCRLGEIINLKSGQDLTKSEYNDKEVGIPYLTGASHIYNNKINVSRWTSSPKLISTFGDLLLTCKGTIGKMAFNTIGDIHIARQLMAIRIFSDTEIKFVKYFIENYTVELLKKAKSLIPGIARDDVLHIKFPLPPILEQKAIVEKVEILMQKCQVLEQEINNSKQNAQMLMQAVLKEAFEVK